MTSLLARRLLVAPLSVAVIAATSVAAVDLSGSAVAAIPAASSLSTSLTQVSAAPKSSDVWALGRFDNLKSGANGFIVSHRHNGHWANSNVSLPKNSVISGIAALSAKTAWVTGYYESKTFTQSPLVDRTVGKKLVKVKAPFKSGSLSVISASGPKNVWVLGSKLVGGLSSEVVLHWGGKKWVSTKLPKNFSANTLSTSSATNTWALGTGAKGTAVARWGGKKWVMTSYHAPALTYPSAIATASKNSTFVVGEVLVGTKEIGHNYTARWNGKKWKNLKTPSKPSATLNAVTAVGGTAWAIGVNATSQVPQILHFASGSWHVQKAPSPGFSSGLTSVSASSPSRATAVGSYTISKVPCGPTRTFAADYNGHSWVNGGGPAKFRGFGIMRAEAQPDDLGC